jgi:putative spermidine/putrescine transport system permease protein
MSAAAETAVAGPARRRLVARPGVWLMWGILAFFLLNLAALVGAVIVRSVGDQWFGTWWPKSFSTKYYADAWREYKLGEVLWITLRVSLSVVFVSVLLGVPAAYALARRTFPGKNLVMLLFVLPIMVPPIAYGIPLATVLLKVGLGHTLNGVILANLVPSVPFVVLTMTPFIEQIDPKIEAAARMCGATTRAIFLRILAPLLLPGILASAILVLVRTVGMFELTFLTSGFGSETLIVVLYHEMYGAGIRAPQRLAAMAVIYMVWMLLMLIVAMRFVNPTQLVTRVDADRDVQ